MRNAPLDASGSHSVEQLQRMLPCEAVGACLNCCVVRDGVAWDVQCAHLLQKAQRRFPLTSRTTCRDGSRIDNRVWLDLGTGGKDGNGS